MLVFPTLVQQGKVPNVDFLHLYGPASLDVLALWFRVFGDSLESERTFGLLQHLGIIFGIYTLARAYGHLVAVGAALVATMLILTPIGLTALAWHGGVGIGVVGARVRRPRPRPRRREVAGGSPEGWPGSHSVTDPTSWWPLASPSPGLSGGVGRMRRSSVSVLPSACCRCGSISSAPGPAPPSRAWWSTRWCVSDRAASSRGRRSWNHVDGALQAVAESLPPWWRLPALAANHQLFLWFFAVIVIAAVVAVTAVWQYVRTAGRPGSAADALLVAGAVRPRHASAGAATAGFDPSRLGGGRLVAAPGRGDRPVVGGDGSPDGHRLRSARSSSAH